MAASLQLYLSAAQGFGKAGLTHIPVISLNVNGLERCSVIWTHPWCISFWSAVVYGDTLMYLTNKTRPYEVVQGAADRLAQKWLARFLSEAFKSGKAQALGTIKQPYFKAIAHEFADLPITK